MEMAKGQRSLLHEGGAFNAHVFLVADEDGTPCVEKDFSANPWLIRNTVGRFLIWRESWILHALGSTGLVPRNARKISPFCLREEFCRGLTLRDSAPDVFRRRASNPPDAGGAPAERSRVPVPREFFERLEAGVREIHRRHFVHLDLHNARNIIVGPGFRPVFLDWQSALPTFVAFPPLRRALERIDLAGVYKFWDKLRPGELSAEERHLLHHVLYFRHHFWIPRLHREQRRA